jgi:hypothetical protein
VKSRDRGFNGTAIYIAGTFVFSRKYEMRHKGPAILAVHIKQIKQCADAIETFQVTQPSNAQGIRFNIQHFICILNLVNYQVQDTVHAGSIREIKQCVSDFECN